MRGAPASCQQLSDRLHLHGGVPASASRQPAPAEPGRPEFLWANGITAVEVDRPDREAWEGQRQARPWQCMRRAVAVLPSSAKGPQDGRQSPHPDRRPLDRSALWSPPPLHEPVGSCGAARSGAGRPLSRSPPAAGLEDPACAAGTALRCPDRGYRALSQEIAGAGAGLAVPRWSTGGGCGPRHSPAKQEVIRCLKRSAARGIRQTQPPHHCPRRLGFHRA